jgi:hypothetical protein
MDDVWANSICAGTYQVRSYGNILVQPGDDGLPDIGDLLCCLDGFRIALECPEADIAPCGGNGEIDIGDVLAMLDAFTGLFACPTPCPYRSAVYNPEPYTQVAGRCPGGTAKPRSVIPTGLRLPEAAPLPALKRWAILTACLRHALSPSLLHGANDLCIRLSPHGRPGHGGVPDRSSVHETAEERSGWREAAAKTRRRYGRGPPRRLYTVL